MRGNHLYYDVSDLNAPYDQVPFQGVGGGSLGGSNVLGLGAEVDVEAEMKWKQHSAYTAGYQIQLNADAKERGYCQIPEDGKLGPVTCGLSDTLYGKMPSACESKTAPNKQPCTTPQTGGKMEFNYPWGKAATETRALQISLNEKSAGKYNPLQITGVLNAPTCGMSRVYGTAPSTCQGFVEPTPVAPPPVVAPKPPPEVVLPYKRPGGDKTLLYAGLIALGVAGMAGVGFWAMNRKKR